MFVGADKSSSSALLQYLLDPIERGTGHINHEMLNCDSKGAMKREFRQLCVAESSRRHVPLGCRLVFTGLQEADCSPRPQIRVIVARGECPVLAFWSIRKIPLIQAGNKLYHSKEIDSA